MSYHDWRERRTLRGGFTCRLSESEASEFQEYFIGSPLFHELAALQAERDALGVKAMAGIDSSVEMSANTLACLALDNRCFAFAKEWHETVIVPRIAEEDKAKV